MFVLGNLHAQAWWGCSRMKEWSPPKTVLRQLPSYLGVLITASSPQLSIRCVDVRILLSLPSWSWCAHTLGFIAGTLSFTGFTSGYLACIVCQFERLNWNPICVWLSKAPALPVSEASKKWKPSCSKPGGLARACRLVKKWKEKWTPLPTQTKEQGTILVPNNAELLCIARLHLIYRVMVYNKIYEKVPSLKAPVKKCDC